MGNKELWCLAGGKGGVGKSLIASRLAINIGSSGYKVILVDADFGGPNLHTFLGVKRAQKSLGDFLDNSESLKSLVTQTPYKNLSLIAGNYNSMNSENISHSQKLKFFRKIKKLDCDYIIVDLGSGCEHNTVDFFLEGDKKIVISNPEIPSIENLFHFIKNIYFRKIIAITSSYGQKNSALKIWEDRKKLGIHSLRDYYLYLKNQSSSTEGLLETELGSFSLNLILNKCRNSHEIKKGFSIKSILVKHFELDVKYSGYIGYDETFWKNLSLMSSNKKIVLSPRLEKEIHRVGENVFNNQQLQYEEVRNA